MVFQHAISLSHRLIVAYQCFQIELILLRNGNVDEFPSRFAAAVYQAMVVGSDDYCRQSADMVGMSLICLIGVSHYFFPVLLQ